MTPELDAMLQAGLRKFQEKLHEATEAACKQALATEDCGVRVTHYTNVQLQADVEVTPEVPWGTIEVREAER